MTPDQTIAKIVAKFVVAQINAVMLDLRTAWCTLKKKKKIVILSAVSSDFVIPHGLSTLYRCLLTTLAQDKLYHEKP